VILIRLILICAITTRLAADDPALLEVRPDLICDTFDEFADILGVPALPAQK
jgi:hypothetical protein